MTCWTMLSRFSLRHIRNTVFAVHPGIVSQCTFSFFFCPATVQQKCNHSYTMRIHDAAAIQWRANICCRDTGLGYIDSCNDTFNMWRTIYVWTNGVQKIVSCLKQAGRNCINLSRPQWSNAVNQTQMLGEKFKAWSSDIKRQWIQRIAHKGQWKRHGCTFCNTYRTRIYCIV